MTAFVYSDSRSVINIFIKREAFNLFEWNRLKRCNLNRYLNVVILFCGFFGQLIQTEH